MLVSRQRLQRFGPVAIVPLFCLNRLVPSLASKSVIAVRDGHSGKLDAGRLPSALASGSL
jgi:hypothetical protein